MEQKVCLDTDVIIDYINQKGPRRVEPLLDKNAEIYVSTVSVFELGLRTTNRERAESFLRLVKILDFDYASALTASTISRELTKKGTPLDFRDVFIAASCMANQYVLVTNNKRDFERIDGLRIM